MNCGEALPDVESHDPSAAGEQEDSPGETARYEIGPSAAPAGYPPHAQVPATATTAGTGTKSHRQSIIIGAIAVFLALLFVSWRINAAIKQAHEDEKRQQELDRFVKERRRQADQFK